MLDTTWGRWMIGIVAAAAVVALLAWARNEPGVGGRESDPPTGAVLVSAGGIEPMGAVHVG